MARVITVTSGKGGVGKTNISLNLALHLASEGYRTCLFDADMGLANINILLGLYPEFNLEDVILNGKSIDDIIIRDFNGIDIIPGSSGVQKITELDDKEIKRVIDSLAGLEGYDFLIFDTSAGISKNVVSFCLASSEIILVLTSEPTSLTDAYSLLKVLSLNGFSSSLMVTVNQCKNMQTANNVFTKFKDAVEKYLHLNVLPLGSILYDQIVQDAVKDQRPFILHSPSSNASKCIKNIGRHLILNEGTLNETHDNNSFWTKCLNFIVRPLKLPGCKSGESNNSNNKKSTNDVDVSEKVVPFKNKKDITTGIKQAVPEAQDDNFSEKNISVLLQVLTEGISLVSQELVAIRRIMEADRRQIR